MRGNEREATGAATDEQRGGYIAVAEQREHCCAEPHQDGEQQDQRGLDRKQGTRGGGHAQSFSPWAVVIGYRATVRTEADVDDPPRFRPTVWPDVKVAVPPVPLHRLDEQQGLVRATPLGTQRQPVDELYLRGLSELDLADHHAVLCFMRDHGVALRTDFDRVAGLPLDVTARHRISSANWINGWHLDVSVLTLRYLRLLVRHWVAHQQHEDVAGAWQEAGLQWPGERPAWYAWSNLLTGFLTPFQVRVRLNEAGPDTEYPWVSLDQALALQLANAVNEALPVRRCANETCGRLYVRQQGRAKYAVEAPSVHRTTGTLYCQASCARAQAERLRRRRARDNRTRDSRGAS